VLRFGEKIVFKQTETSEAFEEQRKALEEIMFQGNEKLQADFE
jgi:hypothetical protein